MKNAIKNFLALAILIGICAFAILNFKNLKDEIVMLFSKTVKQENAETIILQLKKVIISPPPLRHNGSEQNAGTLTIKGVISATNSERNKQGIGALIENAKLDYGAKLKLDDMFKNQYFEHISPSGRGPADIASDSKYEYIVIGENLALGNFKDDAALVAAWMASPGHRANILNRKFTEIGVAVRKGTFEGKSVWLAVQEFGEPLSDCPFPDIELHGRIENLKNSVSAMDDDLKAKKQEINSTSQSDPSYDQKVKEYNSEVKEYNDSLATLRTLIDQYNEEVKKFNTCAVS